ncbi:MAG: hypothetical protein HZA34_02065 [Candidatus Pacebacteria bacterium]|nr:hypothetical protein [Candidatus Paceibacterota bacterium]
MKKIKLANEKWVTEDYQKLLWILELDPHFESMINNIRKDLKEGGNPTDKQINGLLDQFDLPQSLFREMKSYILNKAFPPLFLEPGIEKMSLGLTPDVLLQKTSPKGKRREVRVVITKKIAKTKFIEWVEKNWKSIAFDMEALELPKVKIPRWEYFELVKKIVELRDKHKLTFREITAKLDKDDEDYIKTLYHRYKKWIKSS